MPRKKNKEVVGTSEWWAETVRMINDGYDYFWNKRPGQKPGYGLSSKGFTYSKKVNYTDPQTTRMDSELQGGPEQGSPEDDG